MLHDDLTSMYYHIDKMWCKEDYREGGVRRKTIVRACKEEDYREGGIRRKTIVGV